MTRHKPSITSRVHIRALSRVRRIHEEISSNRYPTISKLAALLEMNERTIKRDLWEMRNGLGAPLEYDYARRGWRYRDPGWEMPPVRLSEGVLLAFFTAEHALRSIGSTPEASLLRASLAKLAAYLPEQVSIDLGNLGKALSFQQAPHTLVNATTLQTLAHAAAERRTVSFDYYSQHRGEQTHRRKADVLLLHNFAGDWYAIAYDHLRKGIRDFHAGRITKLVVTASGFNPPKRWNSETYLRTGFYMMRGGKLTTVSIVFDAYQARWMRERNTFHPEEEREELPGGELRLRFPVGTNGLEAVARFCLSYAGHCHAENPAALRKLIVEKLTSALKQHEGSSLDS